MAMRSKGFWDAPMPLSAVMMLDAYMLVWCAQCDDVDAADTAVMGDDSCTPVVVTTADEALLTVVTAVMLSFMLTVVMMDLDDAYAPAVVITVAMP